MARQNAKHARNPTVPVTAANPALTSAMYAKYMIEGTALEISRLAKKYHALYRNTYSADVPEFATARHHHS
jgi:hypothetical protein